MAQQGLDDADVVIGLQEVGGEGVAEGVGLEAEDRGQKTEGGISGTPQCLNQGVQDFFSLNDLWF